MAPPNMISMGWTEARQDVFSWFFIAGMFLISARVNSEPSDSCASAIQKWILTDSQEAVRFPWNLLFRKTPSDLPPTRWGGLLTERTASSPHESKKRWLQGVAALWDGSQFLPRRLSRKFFGKEHDLTASRWVGERIRSATQKHWNVDLLPSRPVEMMASLGLLAWSSEVALQRSQQLRRYLEERKRSRELKELMEEDYRFHSVRELALKKGLSQDAALLMVAVLRKSYEDYYTYMDQEYSEDFGATRKDGIPHVTGTLLTSSLFRDLAKVSVSERDPGFVRVAEAPKLAPMELARRRVRSRQMLLWEYDVLPHLVDHDTDYQDLLQAPSSRDLLHKMERGEFFQKVIALKRKGKIAPQSCVYILQEEAEWRERMRDWELLGLGRLKDDGAGRWSSQLLTLEEVHRELIERALQRHP